MKKSTLLISAAIIIVVLAILLGSIFWLTQPFEIKDGSVVIPTVLTNPPSETVAEDTNPEELTFKGTFTWEEKDGISPEDKSTFYLRIYSFEGDTYGDFNFGEHLIDGWPVLLKSHTGDHYVFESSRYSLVEKVRITADVTDAGISGTVENVTPDISNFVRGSFTGELIPFEEYANVFLN